MHKQGIDADMTDSGLRQGAWFIAYAVLTVFSVFSGGSATTFFAIATMLLLASSARGGHLSAQLAEIGRLVRGNAPLLLALLFVALAWLSLLWSPWPSRTLHIDINITGVLALALAWFHFMRPRDLEAIERYMLLGIVLASLVLLPALFKIFDLRAMLVATPQASPFNRSVLIISVFAAALVALAHARRRNRALAWAAVVLAALCAFNSQSETAQLFLLAFPPLLVMFTFTERFAGWLSVIVAPAIYFAFPLLVPIMRPLLETAAEHGFSQLMVSSSALARQEIWASFLNAAMQRPILGWGLGSERYVPLANQLLDANGMGPWTHAHSLPVQVLVNLGLTGFILAGGIIIAVCLAIKKLPEASRPPVFALATALLVVWSISHGAWQAWWLSVLALALAPLFVQARADRA